MKNFKVGDKVVAYDHGSIGLKEIRATVLSVDTDGALTLKAANGTRYLAHPKQCRKLVAKSRRRLFLTTCEVASMYNSSVRPTSKATDATDIEFIEVKRGAK